MSVGGVNQPPPGLGELHAVQPSATTEPKAPAQPSPPATTPTPQARHADQFAATEGARHADGTNVGRPEPQKPSMALSSTVQPPEKGTAETSLSHPVEGKDSTQKFGPERSPVVVPATGGILILPGEGKLGVFIPVPPVAMPVPEASVFPVNQAMKNLVDPKLAPPSVKSDKAEEAQKPWNWVLPPADYKVDLPEFKGWERAIPRSILPAGGTLERAGEQTRVEVPFGGAKKLAAKVDGKGEFKAPMPGREGTEEIRGRIEGPTIVVERWEMAGEKAKLAAQWRTDLPPPYPIVPSGVRVAQPLGLDAVQRGGAEGRLAVASVVSLIDDILDVYLATGEVLTLQPHGAALLTARELESPHLVELRRSGVIDVVMND